jgi:chemotaxis protein methyltransferase CheR
MPKVKARIEKDPSYPLRIWCAGCAAGEEPYTLSMLVQEALGLLAKKADWGILATDVSVAAMSEAKVGVYATNKIKDLPVSWRNSYLTRYGDDSWKVNDDIRKPILFKTLNLMDADYPFKGTFDIVFCRNVMIYFDGPTRRALVDRIYRYVKPGGYFFVGHSESLPRDTCPFAYLSPATYRKAEGSLT